MVVLNPKLNPQVLGIFDDSFTSTAHPVSCESGDDSFIFASSNDCVCEAQEEICVCVCDCDKCMD